MPRRREERKYRLKTEGEKTTHRAPVASTRGPCRTIVSEDVGCPGAKFTASLVYQTADIICSFDVELDNYVLL